MLHDTCEFSFQRNKDSQLGLLGRPAYGKGKDGRLKHATVRGILMHSSLALTLEGLPLGLAAIKFWTRKQLKGCNAVKKEDQPNPCTTWPNTSRHVEPLAPALMSPLKRSGSSSGSWLARRAASLRASWLWNGRGNPAMCNVQPGLESCPWSVSLPAG